MTSLEAVGGNALVVQNSAIKLTMRVSRLRPSGELYLTSVAVVLCELLKLIASVSALSVQNGGLGGGGRVFFSEVLSSPRQTVLLLVPAGLYTLQNNLLYIAASHLDAAVFQVLAQAKLVATAVLCRIVLDKRLSAAQWVAIAMLAAGVAAAELTELAPGRSGRQGDPAKGIAAVMLASLTSAAAGVYLERLVKNTAPGLWVRNAQLATVGLPLALIAFLWKDSATAVQRGGVFIGFDFMTAAVVAQQAFGGVLTAVVVKYADNVLKGFACGLAVLVTIVVSRLLFGVELTSQFAAAAVLVITAVILYNAAPGEPARCPSPEPGVPLLPAPEAAAEAAERGANRTPGMTFQERSPRRISGPSNG
eukprot:TRINITY_DN22757_c0_g1_i1.p1 TRINITY_DN22757_c0_g1~~TRINITY_DN22757_c0_g1_i1.p1  ORF type:complete len:373 (+),score=85.23 TRINITY_DN22757_c0_g1_i1:29-1120(+)